MSQNHHPVPHGPQASPPNQPSGVEGLMSSLISPGPSTPRPGFPGGPWLEWSNNLQNAFGANSTDSQLINQNSYQQNSGDEYVPPSPTEMKESFATLHNAPNGTGTKLQANSPSLPSDATRAPLFSNGTAVQSPSPASNADALAANEKKLKELKAKLMAKQSRDPQTTASTATHKTFAKSSQQGHLTPSNKADHSHASPKNSHTALQHPPPSQTFSLQSNSTNQGVPAGISADLDNLVAKAKSDAQSARVASSSQVQHSTGPSAKLPSGQNGNDLNVNSGNPNPKLPVQPAEADELSEGEIKSDEDVAAVPKAAMSPKKKPSKEVSIDSEEKSRRESEVEALYKKQSASRDSQEKLRRKSQVDLAYSPLRKPSAASSKLDTATVQSKLTGLESASRQAVDPPSRPASTRVRHRVAEYDSYIPSYHGSSRNAVGRRADPSDRLHDQAGSRIVAEGQSDLQLQGRPQPTRVISHTDTVYLGRVGDGQENGAQLEKNGDSIQIQRGLVEDSDIKDWLELTEYHDVDYRKARLARYRKLKEIDLLRSRLQEEEQEELQRRTALRASVFGNDTTPQVSKMPPPPLTVRDTTDANGNPLTAALAPEKSVIVSSTLKRQHAEDVTDVPSKLARIALHDGDGAGAYSDTSPTTSSTFPFEQRVTRDDGHVGSRQRRRSRSPDHSRRKSASPGTRRHSIPDPARGRTCHNCGEPGHLQTTCPLPRRDGRDRYRAPPKPRKDPRALPNRSNINDDDDKRP